jgi:hypothetical protein
VEEIPIIVFVFLIGLIGFVLRLLFSLIKGLIVGWRLTLPLFVLLGSVAFAANDQPQLVEEALGEPRKIDVEIRRDLYTSQATFGTIYVNGQAIAYTLERPVGNNEKDRSAIPTGTYPGGLRYDGKKGWRVELSRVAGNRDHVQIHVGNFPADSTGCILVGTERHPEANPPSVLYSKEAMTFLKNIFYGTTHPVYSPDRSVTVRITGVR